MCLHNVDPATNLLAKSPNDLDSSINNNEISTGQELPSVSSIVPLLIGDGQDLLAFKQKLRAGSSQIRYNGSESSQEREPFSPEVSEYVPSICNGKVKFHSVKSANFLLTTSLHQKINNK